MRPKRITVLCEYKVIDEKRQELLDLLPKIKQFLESMGAGEVTFFEGTDQPGLFVEEFTVEDMAAYETVKKARYEEVSPVWSLQNACVPGGKNKVHIWAFAKIE